MIINNLQMNSLKRNIFFLCLIFPIFSFSQSFQNPEKVKLVIFHEREFLTGSVQIKINDLQVSDLGSNHFFEIELNAGQLKIEAEQYSNHKKTLDLVAEKGKIYYLKIYREVDIFSSEIFIAKMNEEAAKKELKNMKTDKSAVKRLNNE